MRQGSLQFLWLCLFSLALGLIPLSGLAAFAVYPPPAPTQVSEWDGTVLCRNGKIPPCHEVTPYWEASKWRPVVGLSGGLAITGRVGDSKSIGIIDPATDEFYLYQSDKPKQSGALFAIFLGTEWAFQPHWSLQLGFDLDQMGTQYQSSGVLTQGADVQSENTFTYQYNLTTRQIMAEMKLLYEYHRAYHPYLLLAAGAAYNDSYNFTTNVPPFLTFTREYKNSSTTSFTYAAGFGMDLEINSAFRLGLGYRFTDLGAVNLGKANIADTNVSNGLAQQHMYTNVILAQMTFLF